MKQLSSMQLVRGQYFNKPITILDDHGTYHTKIFKRVYINESRYFRLDFTDGTSVSTKLVDSGDFKLFVEE